MYAKQKLAVYLNKSVRGNKLSVKKFDRKHSYPPLSPSSTSPLRIWGEKKEYSAIIKKAEQLNTTRLLTTYQKINLLYYTSLNLSPGYCAFTRLLCFITIHAPTPIMATGHTTRPALLMFSVNRNAVPKTIIHIHIGFLKLYFPPM